ncbi:MAG: Y-family DNA polymerase [Algiphilus sp.]
MATQQWLCLAPKRLALDALCLQDTENLAVIMRTGQRAWIVASHAAIFPGADLAAVMTARPELRCVERRHDAESGYLQQLAALAHSIGSPVHLEHQAPSPDIPSGFGCVWVEIGKSERLFDGLEGVLAEAKRCLVERDLNCGLAIAPTMEGARLLAQHDAGIVVRSHDELSQWLQDLPVQALFLPHRVKDGLRASGVRRCDALFALASDQLGRRYGVATTAYLDRLLGRAKETRPAHRLPRVFEKRLRFEGSVHSTEGLRFPLLHLFGALSLDLRARDRATRHVRITFEHVDLPETELSIALSTPARDADYWLLMTRERLSRLTLAEEVTAVALRCDHFEALEVPQMDLFETGREQEEAWRQTVERLIARLGEDAVWKMGLADDHRPERAWQRQDPATDGVSLVTPPAADRPLWLFEPPRPLQTHPPLESPAERIETGWWEGEDLRRDYFMAATETGDRLWVYQDRGNQRWYLHGLWA